MGPAPSHGSRAPSFTVGALHPGSVSLATTSPDPSQSQAPLHRQGGSFPGTAGTSHTPTFHGPKGRLGWNGARVACLASRGFFYPSSRYSSSDGIRSRYGSPHLPPAHHDNHPGGRSRDGNTPSDSRLRYRSHASPRLRSRPTTSSLRPPLWPRRPFRCKGIPLSFTARGRVRARRVRACVRTCVRARARAEGRASGRSPPAPGPPPNDSLNNRQACPRDPVTPPVRWAYG